MNRLLRQLVSAVFYIEQAADSMMSVRGSAGLTFTDTVVLPGTTDTNGKGIALSGSLPATVRPVVQVIDNVERNHRLAMVFEVRVGKGRLLVCMADMTRLAQHPESRRFHLSLLEYMHSKEFSPDVAISAEELVRLFNAEVKEKNIDELRNISFD